MPNAHGSPAPCTLVALNALPLITPKTPFVDAASAAGGMIAHAIAVTRNNLPTRSMSNPPGGGPYTNAFAHANRMVVSGQRAGRAERALLPRKREGPDVDLVASRPAVPTRQRRRDRVQRR